MTQIPNLATAPLQELFDFGVKAVIAQGVPSRQSSGNLCAYRDFTDPTLKCFIGHFIPDEAYDPDMETTNVGVILEKFGLRYESPRKDFLLAAQTAHDRNYTFPPAEWLASFRARARALASTYGLSTEVLDEQS